jgi:peptide chain release factor subunit 3
MHFNVVEKPKTSNLPKLPPVRQVGGGNAALGKTTGPANPKVLKIGATAEPTKTAEKKDAKAADKAPKAIEKPVEKKDELAETVVQNDKTAESETPTAKTSSKPPSRAPSVKEEDTAAESREADTVVKEQEEELDEALVQDMYGKEHVNIVFIGHVDAGKSTLGGNILYLTGMVDERTMEKYEKEAKEAGRESWYLSWALDTNKEERAKGKTVEVGRARFETEKRRYTILDAPGHKSYVPNMISGAAQADVGVLVISARKGEFETGFDKGGQTREHAVLAKMNGINKLVVVINKMDDPTVEWSKDRFALMSLNQANGRYDECVKRLSVFLKGNGFNPKTDLYFIPISAYKGHNLKDKVSKSVCPWYDGPSLLEYLDTMQSLERKVKSAFMMPVGGKFRDMGTIVEGKIESGSVRKGNTTIMMPNKTSIEILGVFTEADEEMAVATAGDQVRLRLKGVEEEDISVGFVLCSPKAPVHVVSTFQAQLAIVETKTLLTAGYTCVMHVHTAVVEVEFKVLQIGTHLTLGASTQIE